MKTARRVLILSLSVVLAIGCEVLSFTPLRDNPNDPGATVVAAPVFSPAGGLYAAAQSISISTLTAEATIRYTTDGTDPTSGVGSLYVGPVAVDATLTLKAIAYKGGMTDSSVTSAEYYIAIAPATPQGLSVGSATTSSLNISWSESDGAASYQLYRDTSDSGTFATKVYEGTELTHTDTGLTLATQYYYKAQAKNDYGTSALSAAVSAWTTLSGSAPGTPTGLVATNPTSTSLTISWSAVSGATSYQLFRDTSASAAFTTSVHTGAELTYTDTGLSPESTYYYKVRAANDNGSSTLSAAASGTTAAAAAGTPATPTGLAVSSPAATSLTVSWNASAGATSYQVYRDRSVSGGFSTAVYDGPDSAYADSGLNAVTPYYYRVRATNVTGSSVASAAASGTTTAPPVTTGAIWTQATANAAFPLRYWSTSVVFGGKLWVIGGFSDSASFLNDVWYSSDGSIWSCATSNAAFSARYGHTSVVYDGKMWVIGGYQGTSCKRDVWYSTNGVDWTQATASAAFSARAWHRSVVFGAKMWVIAGWDGSARNDVWSSTDGAVWTQATPGAGFTARWAQSCLAYSDLLWLIGGWDGVAAKRDVWSSADGSTWTLATSDAAFGGRSSGATAAYQGAMWVIGGSNGQDLPSDAWWSADGATWTQVSVTAPFSGRSAMAAEAFDNAIWIVAGSSTSQVGLNDVWYSR